MATTGRACVLRAILSCLPLYLCISCSGSPAAPSSPRNATITIAAGPSVGSTVTLGSRIVLRLDYDAPIGWSAGAIVLSRDDGATTIWSCGATNNGKGGPSSLSASEELDPTDAIYLFAKGHVVNATGLIASLDVALGTCYFRSLDQPTQIDFAKATVRVEKTLNWKFE